jgi:hypothetical protein
MKIMPLHAPETTFLKLTTFEWMAGFAFGLFVPLFLQSILVLFGIKTSIPILVCSPITLFMFVVLYLVKDREQDYLRTQISNLKIPNTLEGINYAVLPVGKQSQ